MAAQSWYYDRLREACAFRKVTTVKELIACLARRAGTDRHLNDFLSTLAITIEPPQCQMSHCEYNGVQGFAMCGKHRRDGTTPQTCRKNREFQARQRERAKKLEPVCAQYVCRTPAGTTKCGAHCYYVKIGKGPEKCQNSRKLTPEEVAARSALDAVCSTYTCGYRHNCRQRYDKERPCRRTCESITDGGGPQTCGWSTLVPVG